MSSLLSDLPYWDPSEIDNNLDGNDNLYTGLSACIPETDLHSIPWIDSMSSTSSSNTNVVTETNQRPWLLYDIQDRDSRNAMAYKCTDDNSTSIDLDCAMEMCSYADVDDIGNDITVETTASMVGSDIDTSDDGYDSFHRNGDISDTDSDRSSLCCAGSVNSPPHVTPPRDDVVSTETTDATTVEKNVAAILNEMTRPSPASGCMFDDLSILGVDPCILLASYINEEGSIASGTVAPPPDSHVILTGDIEGDVEAPSHEQTGIPMQLLDDSNTSWTTTSTSASESSTVTGAVVVPHFDQLLAKTESPDDFQSATSCSGSDSNDDKRDVEYIPKQKRTKSRSSRCHSNNPAEYSNNHTRATRSRRKCLQLWRFLLDSLCNPTRNPSMIRWENKARGIFKVVDTKALPKIWGERSGARRSGHTMNYEKFSRAIRYYYKNQVITSYHGRLLYQFGPNATGWRATANSCSIGSSSPSSE